MEEEHEGGQDVTSWRERKQNNRMVSVSLVSVKFDSEKAKFRGCTVVSKQCEDILSLHFVCFFMFYLLDYKSSDSLWNVSVNIRLQA